jgi:stage V sporulation protein G
MKTLDVEVTDIRKIIGDGSLRASADVKVGGSLLIKGVCVMKGKRGVFVSMPRKASKDGRWFDVLEPEQALRDAIADKVLKSYDLETDGAKG